MRVAQYREIYAGVRDMATSYHACVDLPERQVWERHATCRLEAGVDAACQRATPDDRSRMAEAVAELGRLIRSVEAERRSDVAIQATNRAARVGSSIGLGRAGQYNKSPGRAVRLRRAARSAMRRGYI